MTPGDVHEVGERHVLRVGQRVSAEQADEGLAAVSFGKGIRDVPRLDALGGGAEDRGVDAAIYRDEVRREVDRDGLARRERKLLLDLREVTVFWMP